MGRRTLFVVYLLIAIFVSAQNLLANTKKQDNCLNEKNNTTNNKSAPTTKKNTANNLITNLRTHSNSKLLKEASAYISQKNNIDSALICYSIVYKRYADAKETINDTTLTKTLSGLWYIYFFHYYDYIKANEILKESLNVCKERNLNSSWVYLDFGFMYQMIAEQSSEKSLYNKALSHYKVAYYGARRHNDWAVMLDAFGNIVMVSAELHKLYAMQNEMALLKQIPKNFNIAEYNYNTLLYSGMVALDKKDAPTAIKCFNKQLLLFKQLSHEYARYIHLAHINLAKAYSLQKNYKTALQELKKGEYISIQYETKDTKLEAYKLLYKTFAKIGDSKQSAIYQNKYILLKDSLLNYRLIASVNEMEFENKMKDVTFHLKQLEHEKEMQRMVICLFMIIGCTIVVSLFAVASKNKKLNQSNKALFQKNIELFQSEEKERMRRKALEEHFAEEKVERKYKSSTLSEERKEELLQKILSLMDNDECIFSCDFSANQLANQVGVNYKYISQVINELMQCSFSNLLNKYRIKEACKRIEDKEHYSGYTLEAIGNSVGFKSRSSFIAAFKQITGLTPLDFQRNANAK